MYIHTQSRLTSAIPSLPSWLLVISILIPPLLPVIIIISCHPIPFSNAARGGIHSVLSLCLSSTGCFLLLPMRNYLFPSLHLFIQIFCIIHNRAGFVNRFLQMVSLIFLLIGSAQQIFPRCKQTCNCNHTYKCLNR